MATLSKRELYDAEEYVDKLDSMIANLRTRKPGEAVGKVGKNDILSMRRDELQKLIDDGYTISQIAEAMKNDVFKVLPKTITEIVNNKNKKNKATISKRSKPINNLIGSKDSEKSHATVGQKKGEKNTQVGSSAGSISIRKDSEDL